MAPIRSRLPRVPGRGLHPSHTPPPCVPQCWAGGRNADGTVYADKTRFPNGIKPVADYVHSKGLQFGIYTCAGPETCVGNRPGSGFDHFTQDAASYAEWGVDWVKMDVSPGTGA